MKTHVKQILRLWEDQSDISAFVAFKEWKTGGSTLKFHSVDLHKIHLEIVTAPLS